MHAAIGQYQELLALGAVGLRHGPGGHLQIGEAQTVHGAGIPGGGTLLAQVGLFQLLRLHIVLDAVLVHLQVAHGEDRRAAPAAQIAVPPGGVDGVGEAAGDRRGVDDRQVFPIGADGNVGAGGLLKDREDAALAAGEEGQNVRLPEQIAVAAHLKEQEGLVAARSVQVRREEAEIAEIGVRLCRGKAAAHVDAVLEGARFQVVVGAAVKVDDGLQQQGLAPAIPLQLAQVKPADGGKLRVRVELVRGDGDGSGLGGIEVGGLGRGIQGEGLAAQRTDFDILN